MRFYSKYRFLCVVATSILVCCCKEDQPPVEPPCDDNGLPCITTNGENTFGFRLNGDIWLPKGNVYLSAIGEPAYYENPGNFGVVVHNTDDYSCDHYFGLSIAGCHSIGDYSPEMSQTYLWGCFDGVLGEYYIDTTAQSNIKITLLDTNSRIISGEFEFTLVSDDTLNTVIDVIHVTDGRFDLNNMNIY